MFAAHPKEHSGFTIVELMIVLSIISILAVIALPVYQGYTLRAKIAEGVNAAGGLQTQIAEYYNNYHFFPTGDQFSGSDATVLFTGNNVRDIKLNANCELVVTFNLPGQSDPNPVLRVIPWVDNNLYIWAYDNSAYGGHAGIDPIWLSSPVRALLMPSGTPPPGTSAASKPCGA